MGTEWEITIKKTKNGYHLETYDGEDFESFVYEIQEDENDTKEEQLALRNVFYMMMDYFAVHNDKHANSSRGQYLTINVDDYSKDIDDRHKHANEGKGQFMDIKVSNSD